MMRSAKVALLLLALPVSALAAEETYAIDPLHTFPNFTVSHLGFSTMHGRFGTTKGKLILDESKHTGSVDIVIDAASVSTGFDKRDDHLRSPDFLNVVEFPQISFKSTKVALADDNGSGTVDGKLTIKGVTRPVTLKVDRIHCGPNPMKKTEHRCGFNATTTIKRSDFGVNYAVPAIGDELPIALEVEAIRE